MIDLRKRILKGNFELRNIQINDDKRLLTYRINSSENNFLVFINKEDRDKPVLCEHLFRGHNADPFDFLTGNIVEINDGRIIVQKESCIIFPEV
ncbi:MAG: hypothetical protein AABW83_02845 [Nanoarchaeota archaeon]